MSKTAREIRKTFLDFFEEKGHMIVPSAPIVNKDDPTLRKIFEIINKICSQFTFAS